MTHPNPREWGKAQAAKAPAWSEERWRHISTILGVDLIDLIDECDGSESTIRAIGHADSANYQMEGVLRVAPPSSACALSLGPLGVE